MEKRNFKLIGSDNVEKYKAKSYLEKEQENFPLQYAEIPFSEKQKYLIRQVVESLPVFLKMYDCEVSKFDIKRIHFIDQEKLNESDKKKYTNPAYFSRVSNCIYIMSSDLIEGPSFVFVIALCHELIHALSFESYTVKKDGTNTQIIDRRMGMEILVENDKDTFEAYFNRLNEAVTDRLMEEYIRYDISSNPKISRPDLEKFISPTYKNEKAYLDTLLDELYEKNLDIFTNKKEIFQLFVDSILKGAILPLARLIEKTYGKGAFRRIGEITR